MWCIWFSMIGFLAIHSQICKDRFEFLSFSASTQLKSHVKVLALLLAIQAFCLVLVVASFAYFKTTSYSMNLFMFADVIRLNPFSTHSSSLTIVNIYCLLVTRINFEDVLCYYSVGFIYIYIFDSIRSVHSIILFLY